MKEAKFEVKQEPVNQLQPRRPLRIVNGVPKETRSLQLREVLVTNVELLDTRQRTANSRTEHVTSAAKRVTWPRYAGAS